MNIIFASTECAPFAKTGGLADVVGALPGVLQRKGHNVCVIMPLFNKIDRKQFDITTKITHLHLSLGGKREVFGLKQAKLAHNVQVYFIDHPGYFGRDELYRENDTDYPDNAERFIFYSKAVLEAAKAINFQPDIIHAHDWHSALAPAMLKTIYHYDNFFYKTKSVFTIHNIAYQGIFPRSVLALTDISDSEFVPSKLEFYEKINFMKAGIIYSDALNTVSKKYSMEIQESHENGKGLEGVLLNITKKVHGILNGVDYSIWNPEKGNNIAAEYSSKKLLGKKKCKKNLQEIFNLPVKKDVPVIGMVSRLDPQKGFALLEKAMDKLMALDLQLIVLGAGDTFIAEFLEKAKNKYPQKIGICISFEPDMAHKIYSGSDMFLMPSLSEPCGLGQLIAFKYGSVPIVTKAGGLFDTVKDYNAKTQKGTGFCLKDFSSDALFNAVKRAMEVYVSKKEWKALMVKIMEQDFSWEKSAHNYTELYAEAMRLPRW
ncbi:MAG: glycogen synthase GlgA [Elusimicrobiota bacterium]